VLTLAGDKICAITRFGDNSLLPTSRDHRISPLGYAVDGHRARWPHIDPAIACNDSDTELSSQERPSPQRPDQPGPGHRTSFMITRLPVRPNVATGAEHAFPGRLAAPLELPEPERLDLPFRTGHYVLALEREGACISTYRFGTVRSSPGALVA
jgi:hypothetical protein